VEQACDLETVVLIVQTVSREIVLEKLIDKVLTLALEHVGLYNLQK
jgi:hypothetical protein